MTLAAGDYAVDDGVDSGWMDRNHVPHPAGQDIRGLLHGNVAPRFASITDGTSNTILVSEDAGRPDLYLGGRLSVPRRHRHPRVPGRQRRPTQLNEGSGAGWADYNSEFYTDGDYSPNEHTNWSSNNEVNSFHPGGANHVFADGSVHFIKKSTAASVFASLISPSGGEVISSGRLLEGSSEGRCWLRSEGGPQSALECDEALRFPLPGSTPTGHDRLSLAPTGPRGAESSLHDPSLALSPPRYGRVMRLITAMITGVQPRLQPVVR